MNTEVSLLSALKVIAPPTSWDPCCKAKPTKRVQGPPAGIDYNPSRGAKNAYLRQNYLHLKKPTLHTRLPLCERGLDVVGTSPVEEEMQRGLRKHWLTTCLPIIWVPRPIAYPPSPPQGIWPQRYRTQRKQRSDIVTMLSLWTARRQPSLSQWCSVIQVMSGLRAGLGGHKVFACYHFN